jgi:signal transduction histidine kinase
MKYFLLNKSILTSLILCLLIFTVDYFTDTEAAIGVFYLIPIAIVFNQKALVIFLISLFSSILILINFFIFEEHGLVDAIYKEDGIISLIAIVIVTYFVLKCCILRDTNQLQKELRLKALEEMLFITSHKIRQPVANILGIATLLDSPIDSQEELKTIIGYIHLSTIQLDDFTTELNQFIANENTKIKND